MASGMAGKSFNQANFPGGRPSIGNADANGAPLIPNKSILQLPAQPQVGGDSIANAIQSGAGAAPMAGSSIAGAIQQGAQVAPVQQMAPQQAAPAQAPMTYAPSGVQATAPTNYGSYGDRDFDPAAAAQAEQDALLDARRAEIERRVNEQIDEQQRQANRRAGALGLQGGLAQQGAASIAQKGAAELAGQLSAFELEQQHLADAEAQREWQRQFSEQQYGDLSTQREYGDKQVALDYESQQAEFANKWASDQMDLHGWSQAQADEAARMKNNGYSTAEILDAIESGAGTGSPTPLPSGWEMSETGDGAIKITFGNLGEAPTIERAVWNYTTGKWEFQ